jgi:hypothetical protein
MPAHAAFLLVAILGADAGTADHVAALAAPPERLVCLARHYNLTSRFEHGAWVGVLPGGVSVPWRDGKTKTFEQRLDSPDLEDIFFIPYRAGPIRAVEVENEDPGRIRVEALLEATYGAPPAASARQVRIRFLGMPVRVHEKIVPALVRVAERITRARRADVGLGRFLRKLSGGFAARKIAGTARTSAHAFGIAVDLDKSQSDYWRWQKGKPLRWRNRFPQAIIDAFESEGFIWGGRWYHYDTMHFEYRPELFGPPCRRPVSAASDTAGR